MPRHSATSPCGSVALDDAELAVGVTGDLTIDDSSLGRKTVITSSGCSTAVVWNPWAGIAASMADLDDGDFRRMLCVETANAGPEMVDIPAGKAHRLMAEYTVT
jgi:glucose-6-phosphate 1-epimerase